MLPDENRTRDSATISTNALDEWRINGKKYMYVFFLLEKRNSFLQQHRYLLSLSSNFRSNYGNLYVDFILFNNNKF